LAEAFEEGGHAVEVLSAGIYPCEGRVELVDNALLLVKGGKRNLKVQYLLFR
jgi:hypothetical protein